MPDTFSVEFIAPMLVVASIEPSVAFYRDKFGFSVLMADESIALLERDAFKLYLVTHSPPTPDKPTITLINRNECGQTPVNLVFNVTDCQQTYTFLVEQGVTFLTPPQAPAWGGWRCFALDPDGYLIEIVTE
jgi:catechol 2,3-dioxygenase-like lactoylglutathione lyase family enzyme